MLLILHACKVTAVRCKQKQPVVPISECHRLRSERQPCVVDISKVYIGKTQRSTNIFNTIFLKIFLCINVFKFDLLIDVVISSCILSIFKFNDIQSNFTVLSSAKSYVHSCFHLLSKRLHNLPQTLFLYMNYTFVRHNQNLA